jgi:hypothetical protein
MDSFASKSGRVVPAFALVSLLGIAACSEADGTVPWPEAYPPEQQINRPKGDAGRPDAGARDAGALDAANASDAGGALDASSTDGSVLDAESGDGAVLEAGALDAASGDGATPDAGMRD